MSVLRTAIMFIAIINNTDEGSALILINVLINYHIKISLLQVYYTSNMSKSTPAKARRWCFTWNNYTEDTRVNLSTVVPSKADYLIYGMEIAPTTQTPHLQGYIEFKTPLALTTVKSRLDPVLKQKSPVHVFMCFGTMEENITYCSKDQRVTEYGTPHSGGGREGRNGWSVLREFIEANPDMSIISKHYPEESIKYFHGISALIDVCTQNIKKDELLRSMESRPLRAWQNKLVDELTHDPDDRKVIWYYDPIGNTGKTWMCKYLYAHGDVAYFTNGKASDIAHAYKGERVVVFDFSRSNEEWINYQSIETTKNGMMFSGKYNSTTKCYSCPWVVCMANFKPKLDALSMDRWDIRTINPDDIQITYVPSPHTISTEIQGGILPLDNIADELESELLALSAVIESLELSDTNELS